MTKHFKPKPTGGQVLSRAALEAYPAEFQLIDLHAWNATSEGKAGAVRQDGKRPLHSNWTKRDFGPSRDVLARCMKAGRNVGVRLKATQLVIDVDPRNGGEEGFKNLCDDFLLDPAEYPRVRTGSGGWHCYMSKPANVRILDTLAYISDGETDKRYAGVEFKSLGRQVVAAGSVHPNGRRYRWDEDHPSIATDLPAVDDALLEAITRPDRSGETIPGGQIDEEQAAAILDKLDPCDFDSNDAWEPLMMAVHHASGGDARQAFIDWSTSDPNYAGHDDIIGRRWDSCDAEHDGGRTFKTLNKILRDKGLNDFQIAASDAAADFEGEPIELSPKEEIFGADADELQTEKRESTRYEVTKLPAMLDYAERSMLAAGVPMYQTGGRLVHPWRHDVDSDNQDDVRRKAGALTMQDTPQLYLRELVIKHAPFHTLEPAGDGKFKRRGYAPSAQFAGHFLARKSEWRIPVLNGIIEAPTLRRDGTLLATEGYDAESGLLLDCNGTTYPTIPDKPTRADAEAALEVLLEPLAGFPFVKSKKGESPSRSVMLSAILTGLVRRSLPAAPMHGFSAPTRGTGKTLACNVVGMAVTGREATAMSQGANEEEDEKRLFSVLLQGDQILLLDNVTRPIEGAALCTVLTEAHWKSRILGESRDARVSTNVLMLASGNNLTFKGDMTRRALVCRMDARMEKPESRRFDVDLRVEVPNRRPELVAAGLIILRAFIVAGRPGLDNLEPFGSFEEWSNLVRGALCWLGEPDPCRTRTYIATDDPERAELEKLLHAMHDRDSDWRTAGQLLKEALDKSTADDGDSTLEDAINAAVPKATAKSLGHYLKTKRSQIVGGLRLREQYSTNRKAWRYRVQEV